MVRHQVAFSTSSAVPQCAILTSPILIPGRVYKTWTVWDQNNSRNMAHSVPIIRTNLAAPEVKDQQFKTNPSKWSPQDRIVAWCRRRMVRCNITICRWTNKIRGRCWVISSNRLMGRCSLTINNSFKWWTKWIISSPNTTSLEIKSMPSQLSNSKIKWWTNRICNSSSSKTTGWPAPIKINFKIKIRWICKMAKTNLIKTACQTLTKMPTNNSIHSERKTIIWV